MRTATVSEAPAPQTLQEFLDAIRKTSLPEKDALIPDFETARELGVSKHTLSVWLCCGRYPKLRPTKIGRRVFYKRSIIDAFVEAQTRTDRTPKRTRRRKAA